MMTTVSERDAQRLGLTRHDLELVCAIMLRNGVDARHQPVIFGSRASGRARRYSDLDVGFAGEPLSPVHLLALRDELEESDLPIRVDVVNLVTANERLRAHALDCAVSLELVPSAQP